jgi:IS30 family transposase
MAQTHSTTKKCTFKHLNAFDRGKIAALHEVGLSMQAIADQVGCDKSTISRELKRGTVTQMKTGRTFYETYFPDTAQLRYEENRKACGAKLKLDAAIDFLVFAETKILVDKWSPDAVCGYAKLHQLFEGPTLCSKTLYNYIEQGFMNIRNIDLPMKTRLNTKKKRSRKNKRVLGRSIEDRPAEINNREDFGHWEIDTVIGKKSKDPVLLTLTERKTRQEIIMKIASKASEAVSKAIQFIQKECGSNFSKVFKTITADNGSEFADLDSTLKKEDTDIYFAHPYTSCERGTNERHNGLIRRFIPKGKAIAEVSSETISHVEKWCNQLPRKILGYRTPEECFHEELSLLIG